MRQLARDLFDRFTITMMVFDFLPVAGHPQPRDTLGYNQHSSWRMED